MTRLEKAVEDAARAISNDFYSQQPGWTPGLFEKLKVALDELDKKRATVETVAVPPAVKEWVAKTIKGASLTDTQRRMGLRSTRFVNGPEWNSDVD